MWGFHRTGNSFGTALIKTVRVPTQQGTLSLQIEQHAVSQWMK